MGKIGVVSNDAGGAVVLASYLKINEMDFVSSIHGPAIQVFNQFFQEVHNDLEENLPNIDTLITSTSSIALHEVEFIKRSKLLGIRTISILDHWVNYADRFRRNGYEYLPDEIWVNDPAAFRLAKATFENVSIIQIENPYKIYLGSQKSFINFTGRNKILYCAEPIKNAEFDEYIAIEETFKIFANNFNEFNFVIKPHPTETNEKYEYLIRKFKDLKIKISTEADLINELKDTLLVIGCHTMALVVADWLDIPILNSIPSGFGVSLVQIPNMAYLHSVNIQDFVDEILS